MEDQEDHIQDDPEIQEQIREIQEQIVEFVEALTEAPIQVFQQMLAGSPAVPVETLYILARSFIDTGRETNFLRVLLKHEPAIARHKCPRGNLLLHRAVMAQGSVDVFELILNANPDAVREKNADGFLPFHLTIDYLYDNNPLEVFEILLSRYPGAASTFTSNEEWQGDLPLHIALNGCHGASENTIFPLLNAYPEAAALPMHENDWALHIACRRKAPFEIVERLFQIYPEALSIQDGDGNLPIHKALQWSCSSLRVIKFLIEKYPEGIRSKGSGHLPLHYAAAASDGSLEVVQFLVEKFPAAASTTIERGDLPLHAACSAGASHEVIQLLLDRYDGEERHHNGLNVSNANGQLPLHFYALGEGTSTDTLRHLLELYPESIHVQDINGMLPLHGACHGYHPTLENIRLLVEAAPFNIVQKTRDGRTPYQLVWNVRERHVEIETYLVEKQNEVVAALKEAVEAVADTQLGLPDLVVALVWSFAKPDLWAPDEEEAVEGGDEGQDE